MNSLPDLNRFTTSPTLGPGIPILGRACQPQVLCNPPIHPLEALLTILVRGGRGADAGIPQYGGLGPVGYKAKNTGGLLTAQVSIGHGASFGQLHYCLTHPPASPRGLVHAHLSRQRVESRRQAWWARRLRDALGHTYHSMGRYAEVSVLTRGALEHAAIPTMNGRSARTLDRGTARCGSRRTLLRSALAHKEACAKCPDTEQVGRHQTGWHGLRRPRLLQHSGKSNGLQRNPNPHALAAFASDVIPPLNRGGPHARLQRLPEHAGKKRNGLSSDSVSTTPRAARCAQSHSSTCLFRFLFPSFPKRASEDACLSAARLCIYENLPCLDGCRQ